MKKVIYFIALLGLSLNFACGQKNANTESVTTKTSIDPAIEQTVIAFVKGGDLQDVSMLEGVLHADYRVTINQFMGGEGVTVMKREDYLGMIRDKKMGDKARSYDIKNLQIVNHTAQLQLHMESSELIFDSFVTLVQNKAQKWSILSDAVVAKPKNK
jgi:Putative lumazine-binding